MKTGLAKVFSIPWYPLLFAVYPALALYAANYNEVRAAVVLRPLAIAVAGALTLFLLLRLALREAQRAAFATSVLALLFFSYGHVYSEIFGKWEIDPHRWLLPLWLSLGALTLLGAAWPRLGFARAAPGLNLIALGLVVVGLAQTLQWPSTPRVRAAGAENAPIRSLSLPKVGTPPDIYYIIVDSYGRADLLEAAYGYDNSDFVAGLQALGFYVAECSRSNYVRTELSLTSSLNMQYLPDLSAVFTPENSQRRSPLWRAIRDSAVRLMLENAGYKTVAFATGFAWSELDDADVYLEPQPLGSGVTEFEALLIETTLARHLEDLGVLDPFQISSRRFYERALFVFDSFDDLAAMPGPKFVFIHIIPPHPPFVFGPDGEYIDPEQFLNKDRKYPPGPYAAGYQNQLAYVNKRLLEALAILIAASPTPPVIILQGDHGPWLQPDPKRFWILNAYYLPGQPNRLYPGISPVNSFRVVFNAYFGTGYELLPDISYFSPALKQYQFTRVAGSCPAR